MTREQRQRILDMATRMTPVMIAHEIGMSPCYIFQIVSRKMKPLKKKDVYIAWMREHADKYTITEAGTILNACWDTLHKYAVQEGIEFRGRGE